MRFGCCLNMVSTQPDGTGIEWVEALAQNGFDYVELPGAQVTALPDEDFAALKVRVTAAGIPCENFNNLFPADLRLTGPEARQAQALAYIERSAERAQALGVTCMGFGSGPARRAPAGFSHEQALQQLVQLLQQVGPIVRKRGITLAIEPLRKAECNLINTYEQGVRLADAVGDPNVKVLLDFYHLAVEEEPVQHLLDDRGEHLCHVHVANPAGRVFPMEAEEADYRSFVQALQSVGYDGKISCEAYSANGFEQDAPKTRAFFNREFGR